MNDTDFVLQKNCRFPKPLDPTEPKFMKKPEPVEMVFSKLTIREPAYDIFVLQFRPKKQQFSDALPTP